LSREEGPSPTAPEPTAGAFVGRAAELASLEAALKQSIAGTGSFLFVAGEPGIGKSALVAEFLRRARAKDVITVLRGGCAEQYGSGEAFLPFLDGMSSLMVGRGAERTRQILRTFAPTWCLQLPAAFPGDAALLQRQAVGANKERMLREMADAFDAASREFPVVIVAEDFQWADPSSIDLVRHLSHRLRHQRQRILLLVTLRDANLERTNPALYHGLLDLRSYGREIRPGRLLAADVRAYLDTTFVPHRFPDELAALLDQRTEGHPLFLDGLVQYLRDRGDIAWDGQAWMLGRRLSEADVPAPENVRGMIRRTLDGLEEADRQALQHAAVFGREFSSALLASLLDRREETLEERLSQLSRLHRFLEPQGEEELPDGTLSVRYRFAHSLFPEILYEDLVPSRRTDLHKRAAQVVARRYGDNAPRQAAVLALHFERGRDFATAITWRLKAANTALARHAVAEALDHCERGMALLERVEETERARLSLLLHEKRGAANHAGGRLDLAIRDYTLMRERARATGAADRECDALVGLANALFFARRPDEMAVRAHEALVAAAQAGSPTRLAAARLSVALLLQDTGDLQNAEALIAPLVEEARALGLRSVLMGALLQRGTLHHWRSEYAEAEASLREAHALAAEVGDGFTALGALLFRGLALVNQGRVGEGRRYFEEGVALARRNDDSIWLARLLSQLGWVHRELQDFDTAREHDLEALRVARESAVRWAPEADVLLSLFLDEAGSGQPTLGAEDRQAIVERGSSERTLFAWFFEIRWESAQAEACLATGDLEGARAHAERLRDVAGERGTPTYGITANKLLADLALRQDRPEDAEAPLAAAVDLMRRRACPLIGWRTFATLGRVRKRLGSAEDARAAFGEAAAIVHRIAASVDDEPLRRRFLDSPAVRDVMENAHP
jgi:tetratricopeptide (TPR) repeat protein